MQNPSAPNAGLNSFGYVIAPLIGGILLYGSNVHGSGGGVDSVKPAALGGNAGH
jgi:hypothetical protein